ncbi:MAG: DUF45 domain-containing protein [Eggerthellaceae bacterium]|nr:DUF45 domain-containing protein [Eggerthellaceae bacterium]
MTKQSQGQKKSTFRVRDIDITLLKKAQKRMYIRIKEPDGRVVVTAPLHESEEHIKAFVQTKYEWIRRAREQIVTSQNVNYPPTSSELDAWRLTLKKEIPALLAQWEPIIGVSAGHVTYRNMISRWGSCNVKTGHITFNVQLAHVDPVALEYVVVHELCHLLEASHNVRFHALMKKFLPDYKQRQNMLRGKIRR